LEVTDTFVDSQLDDLDPETVEQVESVDEGAEAQQEIEFIDLDQFADKYVVVQVDGEDIEIPLKEALAGHQRQADYTRKTQDLANQRRELAWGAAIKGAMDQDPAATLAMLAEQYKVPFGQPQPQRASSDDPFDFDSWGDEPNTDNQVDPRYAELEARLARFEDQQAEAQLNAELGRLAQQYGEDFDPVEVVSAAFASGSSDLEATYKLIAFDRLQEANRKIATNTARANQRTQAKREASIVEGGSGAGAGGIDAGEVNTIADAFALAKRQLAN
jgi:hypothetical protein